MGKAWKAFETKTAKEIDGVRNPVSGRARGDVGDVENDDLNIEVKHWDKKLPRYILEPLDQNGSSYIIFDDIVVLKWSTLKNIYSSFGTVDLSNSQSCTVDKKLPNIYLDMLDQAEKSAEKSDKDQIPLVRYHTKYKRGENDIVFIRLDQYKKFGKYFGIWKE